MDHTPAFWLNRNVTRPNSLYAANQLSFSGGNLVIQDETTPYSQIMMSPLKRDLLVVVIAVASGLMLLFFASYAHAEPMADLKVSDTSQITSVSGAGANYDVIYPFRVNRFASHTRPQHATLEGDSHD